MSVEKLMNQTSTNDLDSAFANFTATVEVELVHCHFLDNK